MPSALRALSLSRLLSDTHTHTHTHTRSLTLLLYHPLTNSLSHSLISLTRSLTHSLSIIRHWSNGESRALIMKHEGYVGALAMSERGARRLSYLSRHRR